MAREKTWEFDPNRAYSSASALDLTRYQLWYMAAFITGNIGGAVGAGLWTLYASSDSSTAGTDATDRWVLAGPYDGTKIVRGATTSVHSWIVLKSPSIGGLFWYLTLSFNTSTDAAIRVIWSQSAPSGGTTTATPTAANSWSSGTSGATADYTTNTAAADAWRFNAALASDGSFYVIGGKQSVGPQHALMFWVPSNSKASDGNPSYTYYGYNATSALVLSAPGPSGNIFDSSAVTIATSGNKSRLADGTTICTAPIVQPALNQAGGSPVIFSTTQGTAADTVDSTSGLDFPAWILLRTGVPSTSGASGMRGRLADIGVNGTQAADYSVAPATGSVEYCKIGWIWLPASAVFVA